MKIQRLGLFLITLAPQLCFALMGTPLMFEPSIGYRNESLKLTDLSKQETQFKSALPVYGLKVGYRSLIGVDLNLAGEYSKGQIEVTGLTEKSDSTHQSASAELGVSALGLLKIYLGYSFMNEFKIENSHSLQGFKLSGPAYLAGLQLKLFPSINLGMQYNLNQFNKISGSAYTLNDSTESYFSKIDSQDYNIYLTLTF
jgi:hypothetical protein